MLCVMGITLLTPCYLIRPRGYRAGCITLLATRVSSARRSLYW
jgi:hypothetical protein